MRWASNRQDQHTALISSLRQSRSGGPLLGVSVAARISFPFFLKCATVRTQTYTEPASSLDSSQSWSLVTER